MAGGCSIEVEGSLGSVVSAPLPLTLAQATDGQGQCSPTVLGCTRTSEGAGQDE